MQLKIQINLPQDQKPPTDEQPAPFDPVKIRNFLLLVITLLSVIGFGVYSMINKEPEASLPNTITKVDTVSNVKPLTDNTLNAVSEEQPSSTKNLANTAPTNNAPANNAVTDEITQEKSAQATLKQAEQTPNNINNIDNIESKLPTHVVAANATREAQPTENSAPTAKPITKPTNKSSTASSSIIADTQHSLEQEAQNIAATTETPNAGNATPTSVNSNKQNNAELTSQNPALNKAVRRAQLTSNIVSREPVDNIQRFSLQAQTKAYLFTEIHGKNNQKIFHRWIFKQNIMAEITHNIGSNQWRTYSSKNFDNTMVGNWTVDVVDEDDNVLKSVTFEVSH